jgi:hypothetical protein
VSAKTCAMHRIRQLYPPEQRATSQEVKGLTSSAQEEGLKAPLAAYRGYVAREHCSSARERRNPAAASDIGACERG